MLLRVSLVAKPLFIFIKNVHSRVMKNNFYTLVDLQRLMQRLRDPQYGCPWDVEQTFKSIAKCALEEAGEVVEAIDNQDFDNLEEELGDLLLQVVFHACIAKEQKLFDFDSLTDRLVKKLIKRHPHVFPQGTLDSFREPGPMSAEQAYDSWQKIKLQEKNEKQLDKKVQAEKDALSNLVLHSNREISAPLKMPSTVLPALKMAENLQHQASEYKFDWREIKPVIDKVKEELSELEEAIATSEKLAIERELGDLLFSCVNLSRHLKVDSELALSGSCRIFYQRITYVLNMLRQSGKTVEQCSEKELAALWQDAKK